MPAVRIDNFGNGMRADVRDMTKRAPGTYVLGLNVRTRGNTVVPVPDPIDLTRLGWVNVQGAMGMGEWLVCVADGEAWVRSRTQDWKKLVGYNLSATATEVWMEVVPLSILVYKRRLASENDNSSIILADKIPQLTNGFYSEQGGGLPCMVIQDGTSQPMLIHPDASNGTFTCRRAQTYAEWTEDNPEYVPVGYNMQRVGNILYIAGKSTYAYEDRRIILRSVSGRMLDFMVNIRSDGSKEPNQADGEARTVAHSVDFDPITCIGRVNSSQDNFIVCTSSRAWLAQPNRVTTIFGEPTFPVDVYVGPVGAASQYSLGDLTSDIAIVNKHGIRSLNAVAQTKMESQQSILSTYINDLLEDQIQQHGCTLSYNKYTFFGVRTRYGPGILVYDNNATPEDPDGRFVSLDIHPLFNNVGSFGEGATVSNDIRMFAQTQSADYHDIFVVAGNKVLQLFAAATYSPKLYIGDFSQGDVSKGLEVTTITSTFLHNPTTSTVTATLLVDGERVESYPVSMLAGSQRIASLPFGASADKTTSYAAFRAMSQPVGHAVGLYLEWTTAAELTSVDIFYSETERYPYATNYHQ